MSKRLKLGDKMKVIPIKKQRSNRIPTAYQFSQDAVTRAAETLIGLGLPDWMAYRSIATQLHMNLVEINLGAKLGRKK